MLGHAFGLWCEGDRTATLRGAKTCIRSYQMWAHFRRDPLGIPPCAYMFSRDTGAKLQLALTECTTTSSTILRVFKQQNTARAQYAQ